MTADFAYLPPGLPPELNALTLDELTYHYATHHRDFVLDDNLAAAYLNRFLAEPELKNHANATKCFIHLMRKVTQLMPFNAGVKSLYSQIFNSPEDKAKAAVLDKQGMSDDYTRRVQEMHRKGLQDEIYDMLCMDLRKSPGNLAMAEMLLELTLMFDYDLEKWLPHFEPHPLLKSDWQAHMVFQASKQGKHDLAIELWESFQKSDFACGDNTLNYMGVSFAKTGDTNMARELYKHSLTLDPTQEPVKRLVSEIDTPFTVRDDALEDNPVPILIYSYNKARLLEMTLESVCQSDLGKSDIIVLLNGCTDDSRDVVKRAIGTYRDHNIELLDIPINMGAPAARNYLLDHVFKTRQFKYLAYLDDDVTLPADWLKSLVTAIEEDEQIGAVGCRVLTPEGLLQQYLYRDVTIVKPGLFRLGWPAPYCSRTIGMYDVRRDVHTVMGCCHLIRRECFEKVPGFDIQFSPTQLDDVSFHLDLGLNGWKVRYLGQLECMHYRSTGFEGRNDKVNGSAMGNDVKFYYRFAKHFDTFAEELKENTNRFIQELG